MPKYIRKPRSNASRRNSNSLQETLLKELERQGEKLLTDMMKQFTSDLEKEGSKVLENLFAGNGGRGGTGAVGIQNLTSLVGSLVTYAVNRPHTSTTSSETDRSRDAAPQFRVSRAQAMAEATSELSRSDRNL